MSIFNIWWINVIIFIFSTVIFTQCYKIVTKSSKKDGALTVLLEFLASIIMLAFIPFFKIQWSSDIKVYIFTILAIIFYCLKDRMGTTVRKNLEASTVNILEQVLNVFMIVWGIIFFKEDIILKKILGAGLIIFSNIMIFYKEGKFEINKYVLLGILSNLCFSVALSLNVGISENFNVAIYQSVTLIIPAILICIFEKIGFNDVILEFKHGNWKAILATSIMWSIMIMSQLRAFQLGNITNVAPLCAISVIVNVAASYFFLKEKSDLWKKIIAAIIIILGVNLIK